MSIFKSKLVKLLKENLPASYDYWRTTNPKDDEDVEYEKYVNDVLSRCESKYVIYAGHSKMYGDEYVCVSLFPDTKGQLDETNVLRFDEEFKCLFDTEEEAKSIANKYMEQHPDKKCIVELAYNEDPDINEEWYTESHINSIQEFDSWLEDRYIR